MKIVGVLNQFGFSPIKDEDASLCHSPFHLTSIYQDEDGKYYYKFLVSGGINTLIDRIVYLNNPSKRELELQSFLYGGISGFGMPYQSKYDQSQNKFHYEPIDFKINSTSSKKIYADLSEYQKDKLIMEPNYVVSSQTRDSAALFPDRKLYIGSGPFIYNNNLENFSIENKTVLQIEGIIRFLIDSMYLDEALEIINKIKSSKVDLIEYFYPNYLIVDGKPKNFLDYQIMHIEAMKYVERKTSHLNLQFFKK